MNNGTMQIRVRPEYRGKVIAFILVVAVVALLLFINSQSGLAEAERESDILHMSQTGDNLVYGIIFDAGSTGSRVHVIKLLKQGKELKYLEELFDLTKPGLSDYAQDPKAATNSLLPLLKAAKEYIPTTEWSKTPLALKATAGLRLLPEEQSKALLDAVRTLFEESPFKVGPNAVQIMQGDDEGLFSWFTLNFLAGAIASKKYISVMDLGGGSTQITFVPKTTEEASKAPATHLKDTDILGEQVKLYTHSYLRYGLMSGRVQSVGGSESNEVDSGTEFTTSCLGEGHKGTFKLGAKKFTFKGEKPTNSRYDDCYAATKKVIETAKIDKPPLLGKEHRVAPISYYYDRAVETGLIDAEKGGELTVKSYFDAGKKACAEPSEKQPFLCLDVCYIMALLHDGFGLDMDVELLLRKKIDGTEISWALGAMFELLKDQSHSHVHHLR